MLISHSLVPHDGWKFFIGEYVITGNDWDDLVQNVRAHKVSNGIPFGDLEREIEEQIAKRFPNLVLQRGN